MLRACTKGDVVPIEMHLSSVVLLLLCSRLLAAAGGAGAQQGWSKRPLLQALRQHPFEASKANDEHQQELESVSVATSFNDLTEEQFMAIHKRFKPCFQSKKGEACAWRGSEVDYPGGLHCAQGDCCSKTIIVKGSISGWCTPNWVYCSSDIIRYPEYSYGSCKCEKYQQRCPENSSCTDTPYGPYCKCIDGFQAEEGECVQLDTTTNAEEAPATCGPDDCVPGFCDIIRGKMFCTCLSNYVVKKVGSNREECIPYYQVN